MTNFPSTLEPIGLSRKGDKRRPDGLTYPTWKNGKCLIWDFTCADTLCKSYVKKASKEVGSAAAGRVCQKCWKHSQCSSAYSSFQANVGEQIMINEICIWRDYQRPFWKECQTRRNNQTKGWRNPESAPPTRRVSNKPLQSNVVLRKAIQWSHFL